MRYSKMFQQVRNEGHLAYIPFVVIGDPNEELSLEIIDQLVTNGADGLELGLAFSDPVADGPVIQQSILRPLANQFSVSSGLRLVAKVREKYPQLPIGLLIYANLVFAQGIKSFFNQCCNAGIDSILIADCPVKESKLFAGAAEESGIDLVFIAPPDANDETLQQIANTSKGYTYVLSRKGITGTEVAASKASTEFLGKLRNFGSPPLVQGFGISKPQHVFDAAKAGVDGIITGSAIVNLINRHYNTPQIMLEHIGDYVRTIAQAAHTNHAQSA
ncbi:tryptophan synthase subunit alpha [Kangiella shandongensis]|uniref:tryptophan synthase subunit alpha n=1 Tax=Kangiella shandongensis TaxID=2763258 RepID=UPI001CC0F2BA|nr:tryptophan synthase subunit alpha [Kangiella shandongensis]